MPSLPRGRRGHRGRPLRRWRLGYDNTISTAAFQIASTLGQMSADLIVNALRFDYRPQAFEGDETVILFVRIEEDAGGAPSGTLVTNGWGDVDLTGTLADTSRTTADVPLAGAVNLVAGSTYWVVFGIADATSTDGTYTWYSGSDGATTDYDFLHIYYSDETPAVGARRRDTSKPLDPQGDTTWDASHVRHSWVEARCVAP